MSGLPPGWRHVPLGQLVEVLDSRRIPVNAKERALRLGPVPYYGATGRVGWIDKALFDEPLVLLGEDGIQFFDRDKQKAYGITGPAWVNNHAHVLRHDPELVDRRYLIHYLNWFDYAGHANGTTRLKLTQAAMRKIEVRAPELIEQRRIADLLEDHLSRLDAADGSTRDVRHRLIGYQQRSLEALLDETSVDRVSLGSLLERVEAGRSLGGSAPPAAEDEWGVIKVSAMTWGDFRPGENKAVPAHLANPRFEIRPGDVLVSRANTTAYVGAPVLVRETPPRLLLSDKSLRLVPRPDVNREWLVAALSAPGTRRQISAVATGTSDSMRNISQANLLRVEIPWVSVGDQQDMVLRYGLVQESVRRMSYELRRADVHSKSLRRALVDAAFSGRLTGRASDRDRVEELVGAAP